MKKLYKYFFLFSALISPYVHSNSDPFSPEAEQESWDSGEAPIDLTDQADKFNKVNNAPLDPLSGEEVSGEKAVIPEENSDPSLQSEPFEEDPIVFPSPTSPLESEESAEISHQEQEAGALDLEVEQDVDGEIDQETDVANADGF